MIEKGGNWKGILMVSKKVGSKEKYAK